MKNPPTPSSPPPATSGEDVRPPPSPLKLGKESDLKLFKESEKIKKPAPQMFKTATASSPSSPPPHPTRWSYDVFLSFRGEDSRKNFTDNLYTGLVQKGIITYRDDEELERGSSIVPKLIKAIEESRCVIVILSTNYASSTWCLEELAKAVESMKETGKKVFPVFYDVHPSEVRNQTDYFGEAFSKHEQRFKDDMERVRRWRAALTVVAQMAGWHLLHGNEAKVIQAIVERVYIELNSTVLSESKGLVGMDSHVLQMLSLLDMNRSLDVRVIGIWGMGGIGKTTIAQVVFERIYSQFDACSFLANVTEVTGRRGLVHLQKQLLSDIMPQSNANIHEIDMGIEIIKRCLCTKRVLIILDDVNHFQQLKALCCHDWFGPGSRIIITSRDKRLLNAYGADKIYNVRALTDAEALQLFIRNCFKKDQVEEDFLQLSKHVLKCASGLPLAIEVLSSFLYGKNAEEWSAALERLNKNPDRKLIDVLKVSFDGLSDEEKEVFLDIACFFKGEDLDRVTRILEGRVFCPDNSIQVLIEKSLVTQSGRKLWMHDWIQEMGRQIVFQECCEDPGMRSRLWFNEDVYHALKENVGTSKIQGISLDLPGPEDVHLNVNSFSNMSNLRYLRLRNTYISGGSLKHLSNELRLLEWYACPLKSLPLSFQPDKLVELIMHSSKMEQLWSGVKSCSMLKLIDLTDSQDLIKTPDFTAVPNIETLVLEGCRSLVEVHPSIGHLKKLILLNMKRCISVESLPRFIGLESLKVLTFSGCSRLKEFPEIEGNIKTLLELHLDGTAVVEFPQSIERLTGLSLLNLEDCKNLLHLPTAISSMTSLKTINLTGCSNLESLPADLGSVECLEELDISGTAKRNLKSLLDQGRIRSESKGFRWESKNRVKRFFFEVHQSTITNPLPPPHWHQHLRDWVLPLWSILGSLFYPNLRDLNPMDGAILNDRSLSSLKNLTLSYNNESISSTEMIIILCGFLKYLYQIYCTALMDLHNQSKGSTSVVSETTRCDSRIESRPLSNRTEEILESRKEMRAIEVESVSSMPPIEKVQRTRENFSILFRRGILWHAAMFKHVVCLVIFGFHYRTRAHPLPMGMYLHHPPSFFSSTQVYRRRTRIQHQIKSQKRRGKEIAELVLSELHSPIKQVQRTHEEDEMERSNVKENVVIEEDKRSLEHVQGLFMFCFLFPSDFEFRKHELVQLWIAEGLNMKESEGETMEDAGIRHFDSLESKGFFVRSRCDFKVGFDSVCSVPMYSPSNFFYKVNPVELSVLENRSSHAEYFRAVNGKLDGASESTTQHLSLTYDDIDEMTFGVVPKFKNLRTLLLLSGRGSSIQRVPGDFFLSLNFLTTVKLSRTLISGLPSSVGDVKLLRYLDVSYTPIRRLPESVGSLAHLQTLKLIGCKQLSDLPRSVQWLTALRHLDFDIIGQLDFMPAHLGNLTDLQTLSAFLVDKDDGRSIRELNNLNNLGGALRIVRLENVLSKADAEVADLPKKKRLQRLDLRWTSLLVENIKLQEEILDSLQPHSGLTELQILFYNGTKLPAWLSCPSFTGLAVMTLYKCENCELLPSIGQLPELKFLSIAEMNKVKEIDGTFFRSTDDQVDESFHAFPKLEILEVDIMLNLKEWKEVKEGDLPSLIKLTMESCPELVTLPSFSCLKRLTYFEVRHCRKLMSMDRNRLPTSLESIIIRDCPKLKEWCDKEGDQDLGQLTSCGQSLV